MKKILKIFFPWLILPAIRKSLTKFSKESGCEIIKEWIQPCLNHLHWSAISTTCGTGRIIWSKFNSFKSHIVNKHENLDDPLFDKCAHNPNIQPRKWLLPGKYCKCHLCHTWFSLLFMVLNYPYVPHYKCKVCMRTSPLIHPSEWGWLPKLSGYNSYK